MQRVVSVVGNRVLLIDVFSLFLRCWFALPPLSTSSGEPTAALYGFAAMMLKLLREERPVGASFALDAPGPTFRHRVYRAYKAGRPGGAAGGNLSTQWTRLHELLSAFGFPAFSVPGFEADDILATLAHELAPRGIEPLVVSGDLDTLQLARGPTTVLMPVRGARAMARYDAKAVRARFGVEPEQLPDRMALVGDPSDNIPGVPGVGLRTAARLLARFGDLDGLLAHVDEVEPRRLRDALAAHAKAARLFRELTRLRTDVPLPPGPRFAPFDAAARARVARLFDVLEFRSLTRRLAALGAASEARAPR